MTLTGNYGLMELLIVVGTQRCGVPARVQRAEHKAFVNHLTEPLRRCTLARTAQRAVPTSLFVKGIIPEQISIPMQNTPEQFDPAG